MGPPPAQTGATTTIPSGFPKITVFEAWLNDDDGRKEKAVA
jgi:hypothetical protein